jgi:fluoroquinolone transport system permease protein
MSRLRVALRLDLLLQFRYGFYYAAAFTTLVWISLLSALPESVLKLVVPFMIFADVAVAGYYFIAGMVLFEKGEATLFALVSTPLRFREYLVSKLATLGALAVVMSLIIVSVSYGFEFDAVLLMLGVILTSLIALLLGFIFVSPFEAISSYVVPSAIPHLIMAVPLIHFFGVWESPVFYLFPTQGSLLLLGGAFGTVSLAAWQLLYAVLYQLLWVIGLYLLARRAFDGYIVARKGG